MEREFIGGSDSLQISIRCFDIATLRAFSRNCRNLDHFREFERISNSKNINMLYIILKHVIWRLQIYNLFREIFKFRDFKKAFMNFTKSIIVHIFAIFQYFAKQTIYSDSPDHVLQNDIQHV